MKEEDLSEYSWYLSNSVLHLRLTPLSHTLNIDDHSAEKMNAVQVQVLYYDMDIFLFAVQLLDLIMF